MLIFLDIDGVMVPEKSWVSLPLLSDGFADFSESAVRVLQNLIFEDTKIMLTTSHKSRFNQEEWKEIFNRRGIKVKHIKSLDGGHTGISRKDEILNWINVNKITEEFIIIDDDKSLNALPAFLKDRLVLTSSMVGLTDIHCHLIQNIFKEKGHQV